MLVAAIVFTMLVITPHALAALAIIEYDIPTVSSQPYYITAGPDGNLWFAEGGTGKLGKITPSGAITEEALSNPGAQPVELITGPDITFGLRNLSLTK
jgi:streptogramin lyase